MNNNIIVAGTISSGKSTVLNAFIQKNFFAMGDGVTTKITKQFKLANLQFTDLPGLNEDGKNNLHKYQNTIKKALAIFFLFDKTTIKSHAVENILKTVYENRKHYKDKNIFFILNKLDDITDVKPLTKMIVEQINRYDKTVTVDDILPLSAKNALACIMFSKDEENDLQTKHILKECFGRKWTNHSKDDITSAQLNEIYRESNFIIIRKIIETFDSLVVYKHIIKNNNNIPLGALQKAIIKYNDYMIRTGQSTRTTRNSIAENDLVLSSILATLSVPFFISSIPILGSIFAFFGGVKLINGLMNADNRQDQLHVTSLIDHFGSINSDKFLGDYDFSSKAQFYEVSQNQMNDIKKYLQMNININKLGPFLNKTYLENIKYEDITFFEMDNNVYMVYGEFKRNELVKVTGVVQINPVEFIEPTEPVFPKPKSFISTQEQLKEQESSNQYYHGNSCITNAEDDDSVPDLETISNISDLPIYDLSDDDEDDVTIMSVTSEEIDELTQQLANLSPINLDNIQIEHVEVSEPIEVEPNKVEPNKVEHVETTQLFGDLANQQHTCDLELDQLNPMIDLNDNEHFEDDFEDDNEYYNDEQELFDQLNPWNTDNYLDNDDFVEWCIISEGNDVLGATVAEIDEDDFVDWDTIETVVKVEDQQVEDQQVEDQQVEDQQEIVEN
jgi:GTPase Era involved in 16S rRNA processing